MGRPSRAARARSTEAGQAGGGSKGGGKPGKGERVAKAIARAGLASRREAEGWIAAGRVALNGRVLDSPAVLVGPGDALLVDGKPLPERQEARVWRYHKPPGLITTRSDPRGRTTVFDSLPEGLRRLLSVGRLDMSSEGLLLLTNDGALKRHMEMPATGWSRRYRVRVHGQVDAEALAGLAGGCTVSGIRYGPMEARLERQVGGNAWLSVAIREGKNREVRKVLESLGLTVNRLIRVSYGPFQLASLPRGAVEEVKPRVLREQLGGVLGIDRPADQSGRAKAKPKPTPHPKSKTGSRARRKGSAPTGRAKPSKPSKPSNAPRADRRRRS